MATLTKQGKACVEALREYVTEETTLYMMSDYVGNVGTVYTRVLMVRGDTLTDITWYVSQAIGDKPKERHSKWVIRTGGAGYSRAQHIADRLSWALFGRRDALAYKEM